MVVNIVTAKSSQCLPPSGIWLVSSVFLKGTVEINILCILQKGQFMEGKYEMYLVFILRLCLWSHGDKMLSNIILKLIVRCGMCNFSFHKGALHFLLVLSYAFQFSYISVFMSRSEEQNATQPERAGLGIASRRPSFEFQLSQLGACAG